MRRAVPFDAARLRATGTETVVLPGVRRLDPLGTEENVVTFSVGGALAYVEGSSPASAPPSRLAWVSRDGRQQDAVDRGELVDIGAHYEAALFARVNHDAARQLRLQFIDDAAEFRHDLGREHVSAGICLVET